MRKGLYARKGLHKIAGILLVVLLICSVLGGCSKEGLDDEEKEILMPKQLEEASLTFYFIGPQSITENRVMFDELEKKTEDTLNIRLNFKWIDYKTYDEKITELIKSGDTFEAFGTNRFAIANYMRENLLLDITALFPEHAPNYFNRFSDEDRKDAAYNGKLVAVPHYMPGSMRMCAVVREDLMKKYSLPVIENFEDYELYLKTISEKEAGVEPPTISGLLNENFAESFGYVEFSNALVYKWDDPDMKLIPWEQTDGYRIAVETLKRWRDNGYIDTTTSIWQSKGGGNIHTYLQQCNYAIDTASRESSMGKDFRVYPLYMDRNAQKSPVTDKALVFNKNAKNPERALRFIEWVHASQENYDLLMYGLLGTDYSFSPTNTVVPGGDYSRRWMMFGGDAFEDLEYLRPFNFNAPDFKEQISKFTQHNTNYPPHKYLDFTGSDIAEEKGKLLDDMIMKRQKAFETFENDMRVKGSEVDLDKFIQEQKDAGVENLLKEMQQLIDTSRTKSK